MSKFRVGDRVLVTAYKIESEPATVEDVEDGEYWCVFDSGHKEARISK